MFEFDEIDKEDYQTAEVPRTLNETELKSQEVHLDMSYAGWKVDYESIDEQPNDVYALHRKKGLGGSDSSVLLGVNPFKSVKELIAEKARDYLTAEEKAVGEQEAVKKGASYEPWIIHRAGQILGKPIYKPKDMYRCTEFPYLAMNFDGVIGEPEAYSPCEIKVCTAKGERHYDTNKAIFNEFTGFTPLPKDISNSNNSVRTKAAYYGIPPYYYTQLQQEIMASGALFGYLTMFQERSGKIFMFYAWRDNHVITDIIRYGYNIWEKVCEKNPSRRYG